MTFDEFFRCMDYLGFNCTCSTCWCQKNYLEKPQSVESRNKKQEEKIKLNRKNWKENLLKLEMGAWQWRQSLPPSLPSRKCQELVFCFIRCKLMSKPFNTEFQKKKSKSSQPLQFNTEFRKNARSSKNSSFL